MDFFPLQKPYKTYVLHFCRRPTANDLLLEGKRYHTMSPFDRAQMTSYSTLIWTMHLSYIVLELKDANEFYQHF